jgi:hypothetical protein
MRQCNECNRYTKELINVDGKELCNNCILDLLLHNVMAIRKRLDDITMHMVDS